MKVSVNTNQAAMVALQNMNTTSDDLRVVQDRISTGRRIADAKDNASIWNIAQAQRGDFSSLSAVRMGLDRAASIADIALTAGTNISDLFIQIREKVVAANDTTIDTNSRALINQDYRNLITQIGRATINASFDGANLFNNSITGSLSFLANAKTTSNITLTAQNLTFGGPIITLATTDSITTAALAATVLTKVTASMVNLNRALGMLGSQLKQIDDHNMFLGKMSDAIDAGIGNLVDADLAKESARLQALNVKQELGTQSLAIANRQPQQILNLFK
jgi:flagellin